MLKTIAILSALFIVCYRLIIRWDRKRKVETMDQGDLSMGNKYDFDEQDIYR